MDDDGHHRNDTSYGQTACIAHEDLGRISIVPEKSYQGTHKGTEEYHQFLTARNKHDVEVTGKLDVTAHISQDTQGNADDGRIACAHAIHTIVHITAIADCHDDEHCHQDKDYPSSCILIFSQEAHHLGIIQIVVLDKGDGGLGRLDGLTLVYDHALHTLTLCGDILTDDSIGAQPECQPDG